MRRSWPGVDGCCVVGRTISARAWAYVGRDPAIVVYDFTTDKAGAHVRSFLRSWKGGWLQADAASNYDELYRQRPEIREVGCWAHARRKFFEIATLADKSGQRVLAHEAVERIGELFAIERAASEAGDSPPERGQRRQREARPILDALRAWCEEKLLEFLPKSQTALAIGYTLKHWAALTRYLDDGAIADSVASTTTTAISSMPRPRTHAEDLDVAHEQDRHHPGWRQARLRQFAHHRVAGSPDLLADRLAVQAVALDVLLALDGDQAVLLLDQLDAALTGEITTMSTSPWLILRYSGSVQ